tara:strand:+ start:120 stop:326 length:207 start_codon:yes stop_codon:yes gene_type:complete
MTQQVVLHCKPEILENRELLNSSDLLISNVTDLGEIDIYVNDLDTIDDEELCLNYGINYDLVNCVELA